MRRKLLLGIFKIKRIVERWFGTRALDAPNLSLRIHTRTIREYLTRARSCAKEPETCAWLARIAPGSVLYDVGANVGAYTLVALGLGAHEVVAIEPSLKNAATLHENCVLNGVRERCTILSLALGAESGVLRVTIPDDTAGATAGFLHADGTVPIPLTTLDVLIAEHALPHPTALKIDVDGAEMAVLEGAAQTLADQRLVHVLVEAAPELHERVCALLTQAGFVQESVHDRGQGITNTIFVRHAISS